MNKRYVSGRRYEYKTIKRYKDMGYLVFRTAGSKGFFDVIAIGNDHVYLIQVKSNTGRVKAADLEELQKIKRPLNAKILIETWTKWMKEPQTVEIV